MPVNSRGWMGFSILWGLKYRLSLATLFYQVASHGQHPTSLCAFWRLSCLTSWLSVCCAARTGEYRTAGNPQVGKQLLRSQHR